MRIWPLLFALLLGCSTFEPGAPSYALADDEGPLGALVSQLSEHAPTAQSGFYLLDDGTQAFVARAELARGATKSLDVQYYIMSDGLSTALLLKELLSAADRGVRVRLLLDDTAIGGKDDRMAKLAAHPNISVRSFNPIKQGRGLALTRNLARLFNLSRQHRRMHNKLWLADGQVGIVGGRNLGDEYFDAQEGMNFNDIDVMSIGAVNLELAQSFDQYWNHALAQPIENLAKHDPKRVELNAWRALLEQKIQQKRQELPEIYERLTQYKDEPQLPSWLTRLYWAHAKAMWDDPDKLLADGKPNPKHLLTTQLNPELEAVHKELLLVSAYFVPGENGTAYLTTKAREGTAVHILTNALEATDVPAVHGGYSPYRKDLLASGVNLYELRREPGERPRYSFTGGSESSLHSKTISFDRKKTFIGSFNFDPRSVLWNTEIGILIDSEFLTEKVRSLTQQGVTPSLVYRVRLDQRQQQLFWETDNNGVPVRFDKEPGTFMQHLNAWLARFLGLERML